jgi:hypothetical protein
MAVLASWPRCRLSRRIAPGADRGAGRENWHGAVPWVRREPGKQPALPRHGGEARGGGRRRELGLFLFPVPGRYQAAGGAAFAPPSPGPVCGPLAFPAPGLRVGQVPADGDPHVVPQALLQFLARCVGQRRRQVLVAAGRASPGAGRVLPPHLEVGGVIGDVVSHRLLFPQRSLYPARPPAVCLGLVLAGLLPSRTPAAAPPARRSTARKNRRAGAHRTESPETGSALRVHCGRRRLRAR